MEGVAKRSKEQMVGRTSQNKTAVFPRAAVAKVGQTVRVEVVDATATPSAARITIVIQETNREYVYFWLMLRFRMIFRVCFEIE